MRFLSRASLFSQDCPELGEDRAARFTPDVSPPRRCGFRTHPEWVSSSNGSHVVDVVSNGSFNFRLYDN